MFLNKSQLDYMRLGDKIAKALKPLQRIITDLQNANEDIDISMSKNNDEISSMREEIDSLKTINGSLSRTKASNEKTIENLNNLIKGGMSL